MAENKFAPITQQLLNSYPSWSAIRNDEQSNGASFMNAIGLQLQDLHEQLVNQEKNYTIPYANVNEIDIIYKMFLPKTYEFPIQNEDLTNPVYTQPTVYGFQDGTQYTINVCDNNDIESFWYHAIPQRMSVTSHAVTNIVNDTAAVPMYGCIASITQDDSPYSLNITLDEPYTRLWVQAVGGQKYIDIGADGIVRRASVVVTGITRAGIEASETLIFIQDDVVPTMKDWQSISKVEVYDVNPSTVNIRLFAQRFRRNQTPLLAPPKTFYNFYVSPESKQTMETFWDLGHNTNGNSILQLKTWQVDDIRTRLNGFVDLDTIRPFELRTNADAAFTSAADLCVEPFSNRVWVVTNDKLFLYDGDWGLPNMQQLDKKFTAALSVIECSAYHITPGDSVTLEYLFKRQITDATRHRVWVQYPDGTTHNAHGGSFSTYDATAFIDNFSGDRMLRQKETYTLTQTGDYIFNLEVHYANGAREIDQRIISTDRKKPLAEFSLTSYLGAGSARGVDIDSDGNLWILVQTNTTWTKLKVVFSYDTMMIDYQNKILYFRDQYDQVRIAS